MDPQCPACGAPGVEFDGDAISKSTSREVSLIGVLAVVGPSLVLAAIR